MNKIEVSLSQESISTKNGRKKITDLAPPRVFSVHKAAINNVKNVHEKKIYLKSQYLAHNEEQRTLIQNTSSQEDISSFEAITDYPRTFPKSKKMKILI